MAFCIGPFCGKFRDELNDSDSEEEDDGSNMRAKTKGKAKRRPKKERNVASTNMMWAPYLSEVRMLVKRAGVEEMKPVTQLKTPYNQNFSENMLNRLNQLQQVEIMEIAKCNLIKIPPSLEELEGLMILTLSYNNIRKFNPELARCEALERIVLDWNQIGEIEPGIFSDTTFHKLEVINLSHNRLTVLPNDFPRTAGKALRYVDLSYNQLTMVPTALMECKEMKELNLSHNRLTTLPDKYELKKLRKLFLSFNELVSLPENIGTSEKLEKLRITSNQIKRLPYSILKLWKNAGGQLEELLVDRNPLLVPSITAFEMESGAGGMNRAFELLQEHQKEDEEQKRMARQNAMIDQEEQAALPGIATESVPPPPMLGNGEQQTLEPEEPDPNVVSMEDAPYFEEGAQLLEVMSAPNHSAMETDDHAIPEEPMAAVGLRPATEQLTILKPGGGVAELDSAVQLKTLLKKVSLSEYDCQQVNKLDGIEEGSVCESERSVDSAELSEDAQSDMTEFDAQAFLLDELDETHAAASRAGPSRFTINSDSALRRLMEVPVREIWEGRRQAQQAVEVSGPFKRQVLNKPQRGSRTPVGELAVRRALRDAYRNMPFHEFSSFISFILRQLHSIRENKPATAETLWHDDDPAFRYAVGAQGHNKYTCRLLEIMGFVHLNNKYWIWPLEHLKSVKTGKCWAHLQVPSDCPGMLSTRLGEMINVLANCIQAINEKGPAFTGYFPG